MEVPSGKWAGTLTINSNIASLNAQRRLGTSTASLQQSFERLSSGLRINRASDDAAGLSIASSLNVDSRVYTQAVRNTNDATSLFAIAEAAVNSLVDITTRLKELAEQSSNGVLSYTQRKSLNAEAQALGKEYQRIIQTTQFNGQTIINGSSGPLSVQVGYDALRLSGGNAPTGTFNASQSDVSTGNVRTMVTADVTGDGLLDLVSADYLSAQVSVYVGNGDGTFRARQAYATNTGGTVYDVVAADIDGDGALDLVSADEGGGTLSILTGNGNGTFKARKIYSIGGTPNSVSTGDLNGDGKMDLVTTDSGGTTVSVLLGNGNGTFQSARAYTMGGNPYEAYANDVNGDGILDLVSMNAGESTVGVLLGNGDGTFRSLQKYTSGSAWHLTISDLNGDGISDVVTADIGNNTASVLIGNGDGSFKVKQVYSTGATPQAVLARDMNGDDIADLVVTERDTARLSVFFGNGDGTFKPRVSYSVGTTPTFAVAGDFDRDGIVDLAAASFGTSQINVLLGNSAAQEVVAPTIGTYSLLSQSNSRDALTQFTQVLNSLTASLGQIGANESRLQTATSVLQQTRINYDSAASQIMDVDVATEAANLTKGNILQQAGAAILTQANQQPSLALRLLQGI